MNIKEMSDIAIRYECCRFLINILDSGSSDEEDMEIAAMMLKEQFTILGKLVNVIE